MNLRIVTIPELHYAAAACSAVRRSITELCDADHHNNPEILAAWLENKTVENFEKWFNAKRLFNVLAVVDDVVVGCGSMMYETGHLQLLYITPEVIGKGVGKQLLVVMEKEAIEKGLLHVTLESTKTALPFYTRMGYVENGEPQQFRVVGYPMKKILKQS